MYIHPYVGDSMSKVREKRSMSKSGLFWMKCERLKGNLMILRVKKKNFCHFCWFLALNKNTVKIEEEKIHFFTTQQLISNIIYAILIV